MTSWNPFPRVRCTFITRRIIGCAMKVHRTLGNGFQEVIYQRALALEMAADGLDFTREHEMPVFYRGEAIGTRRVDFFVEGVVMLEAKGLTPSGRRSHRAVNELSRSVRP